MKSFKLFEKWEERNKKTCLKTNSINTKEKGIRRGRSKKLGIKLNDALINMSEHDKSKNTDVRDDSDTNQLRIRLLEKQVEIYEL